MIIVLFKTILYVFCFTNIKPVKRDAKQNVDIMHKKALLSQG
jgi:hypothetical protein